MRRTIRSSAWSSGEKRIQVSRPSLKARRTAPPPIGPSPVVVPAVPPPPACCRGGRGTNLDRRKPFLTSSRVPETKHRRREGRTRFWRVPRLLWGSEPAFEVRPGRSPLPIDRCLGRHRRHLISKRPFGWHRTIAHPPRHRLATARQNRVAPIGSLGAATGRKKRHRGFAVSPITTAPWPPPRGLGPSCR